MSILSVGVESQATPFVIRLLDGPNSVSPNGQPIEIKLEGRALPYRGTTWETEQRSKLTWYAGNPVATQQILGPVDNPTSINGVWKDRFLGNGRAAELVRTFDDVCRAGINVEVTWGDYADNTLTEVFVKPLVRRGIIKRFRHSYDRIQDITWEIEFEWRGRDEPTAPPLTAAGVLSTREGFGQLADSLSQTLDAIEATVSNPFSLLAGFLQSAEQSISEVEDSLQRSIDFFNGTTRAIVAVANLPRDTLERGRSLARAAADAMVTFKGAILDQIQFTGQVIGGRDEGLGLADQRDELFDLLGSLDVSGEIARQTDEAIAGQIEPEVIETVAAVPGSDLRDLARQFYGDPDVWTVIANYNGLDTSRVPDRPDGPSADRIVVINIPRRQEGDLAKLSQGAC